ncbi:MAG: hypothetical protein ABI741_01470 [Ferruginibacter sp.]
MRKINLAFTLLIASMLFSCNDDKKETAKEETTTSADTATSMKMSPGPAAFTPFDVAEISHSVKDYAKWRPFFDADSTNRKASGLELMVVGRSIDKPNNVIIALQVSDLQKAKDFSGNPKLKEVMDKAGVISKPDIQFFHIIRFNPDSKEKQWVRVTHRVKDFDEWLKVFDNEGTANRASQGLIDVALGRGIDDPNIVTLVFDIKDMAKAKASILSEEKKKLMMSAGVEGVPTIGFYSTAE